MKVQTLLDLHDTVMAQFKKDHPYRHCMQDVMRLLKTAAGVATPERITYMEIPRTELACENYVEGLLYKAARIADRVDLRELEVSA